MDDAATYFQEVVEPNAQEFLQAKNLGSRRLAFNAAVSLAHMVEHVFEARKDAANSYQSHRSSGAWRQALYSTCPDLELLVDVSNASKHAVLRVENNRPPRQISGAGSAAAMPVAANSSFIMANDSFVPANAGADFKVVVVTFTNGKPPRALHPAVARVLDMWRTLI
jgi:hypothetical protein